jgi:hypothetical protein
MLCDSGWCGKTCDGMPDCPDFADEEINFCQNCSLPNILACNDQKSCFNMNKK